MDAQQLDDNRRLLNRRFDEKVRLRNAERKLLGETLRAKNAVIEQEVEKGRIDGAAAAAWRQAVISTVERETAIIMEQYKLE